MFDRTEISYYIMIIWVLGFITMWTWIGLAMPQQVMTGTIDLLISHIEAGDWQSAQIDIDTVNNLWQQNKFVMQLANGSEQISAFEETLGELKQAVKNNNDSAISSVGAFKTMAREVTSPFPGP